MSNVRSGKMKNNLETDYSFTNWINSFGPHRKMKIVVSIILLTTPIWMCLIFWAFPFGSVGPFVLLTWLINSILIPILLIWLSCGLPNKKTRVIAQILAIPLGLIIAYIQFVSYLALTPIFGLDDFHWI